MTDALPTAQTSAGSGSGGWARFWPTRLLERGCDLTVYNRTSAKAFPLVELGARLVEHAVDLADRDIVITMVAGSKDFEEVMSGPSGLLADSSTRTGLGGRRVHCLDDRLERDPGAGRAAGRHAPRCSRVGQSKAARAGMLSVAVSGPYEAYERALPYLQMLGRSVSYVGEGEAARLVKICHNLVLGVVAQILAETTVLAESAGLPAPTTSHSSTTACSARPSPATRRRRT